MADWQPVLFANQPRNLSQKIAELSSSRLVRSSRARRNVFKRSVGDAEKSQISIIENTSTADEFTTAFELTTAVGATEEASSLNASQSPPTPVSVNPTAVTVSKLRRYSNFWVNTILSVPRLRTVYNATYQAILEERLALAIAAGFVRLREKDLRVRRSFRRVKRAAKSADLAVQLIDVSRGSVSTEVIVTHVTANKTNNNSFVPAKDVIAALNTFSKQELALQLQEVVTTNAEPFYKTPTPTPELEKPFWIIGAVFGAIVVVFFCCWISLCIYYRFCRQAPATRPDSSSPNQHKFIPNDIQGGLKPNKASAEQSKKMADPKSIANRLERELDWETLNKHKSKKSRPGWNESARGDEVTVISENGSAAELIVDNHHPPVKKKKKKVNRRRRSSTVAPIDDDSHRLENNATTQTSPSHLQQVDEMIHRREELPPIFASQGLTSQPIRNLPINPRRDREIDAVLGDPEYLPDVFTHDPGYRSYRSGATGDESLEQARQRMHDLLDEAFSMITPRLLEEQHHSPELDKPAEFSESFRSVAEVEYNSESFAHTPREEPHHTPMHFHRSDRDREYRDVTWTPYRAGDEIAHLTSMSNEAPVTHHSADLSPRSLTTYSQPTSRRSSINEYTSINMTSELISTPPYNRFPADGGSVAPPIVIHSPVSSRPVSPVDGRILLVTDENDTVPAQSDPNSTPTNIPVPTDNGDDLQLGDSPAPFIASIRGELSKISSKIFGNRTEKNS
ncbi:uncharacterized protein LOC141912933 [Tubulanus polymorphus]|uniref:uncharacterized protein LOC141912933 n=1 Tax=Tubulanus polymorphus TaxID=672921 RepID=UPI003DA35A47